MLVFLIMLLFKSYGVNFELYGSAINALSDNYCSLFYDIEKYFGSKGNFFDIELFISYIPSLEYICIYVSDFI